MNTLLTPRLVLTVNLAQLRANFLKLRSRVATGRLLAVVKANAYGLGVREVAAALRDAGAYRFGVADLSEAVEIADLGLPVQLLSSVTGAEIPEAVERGFYLPLADYDSARAISAAAAKCGKTVCGQLKIDSGMGRLGMPADSAFEECLKIAALPSLRITGIMTHLSNAGTADEPYTLGQMRKFEALVAKLQARGMSFEDIHCGASDALLRYPAAGRAPYTMERAGIVMYGLEDGPEFPGIVTLKGELVAVRELAAGASIGYCRTCRLDRAQKVGTLAAGYADGVPLALSNRGAMLVGGVRCKVLGRVSMDYTTLDVEPVAGVHPGSEVILWGRSGGERITPCDWAALKSTHCHDILCAIGRRVQRRYIR